MRRWSVVVSTLGITQTLAWGSTYYLAAVFADLISDTLQLPHVWFFGIFSASLLLWGLLGPLAGRIIDEHGGRDVLAATNLVFAAGLVCLALIGPAAAIPFVLLHGAGNGIGAEAEHPQPDHAAPRKMPAALALLGASTTTSGEGHLATIASWLPQRRCDGVACRRPTVSGTAPYRYSAGVAAPRVP
jgi:MFS family permease